MGKAIAFSRVICFWLYTKKIYDMSLLKGLGRKIVTIVKKNRGYQATTHSGRKQFAEIQNEKSSNGKLVLSTDAVSLAEC